MTSHHNALIWGAKVAVMSGAVLALFLATKPPVDAGTYRLVTVGGSIRATNGDWAVIRGKHVSVGLGDPYCANGTIHVPVDGDADGFGTVSPDSVYARLGYVAGLSISPDEWRLNVVDRDGQRVDCDQAQPTGSNWWLNGQVPVR